MLSRSSFALILILHPIVQTIVFRTIVPLRWQVFWSKMQRTLIQIILKKMILKMRMKIKKMKTKMKTKKMKAKKMKAKKMKAKKMKVSVTTYDRHTRALHLVQSVSG